MDTLVLGQTYEPLDRVTWRRAMTLWVAERVEILEHYDSRPIRTVRAIFPRPSVIRFFRSLRRDRLAVKFSRDNIYARDRGRCQYCAQVITKRESTYDHVLPRSRGGMRRWDNIVLACKPCNQHKGNRTPEEARMRLRKPPRRPTWLPEVWRWESRAGVELPDAWKPYLGLAI